MGLELKGVEALRVGGFEDMNGQKADFSLSDLQEIANTPLPPDGIPLVFGHPKTDSPAYGWVEKIRQVGDRLVVDFRDVFEPAYNAIKNQLYTNRSLKLSKNADGTWRIWHVGFLGAKPPAVEGLAPISLSGESDDALVFEFSGYAESAILQLFRGLREMLLTKFDQETADAYLPSSKLEMIDSELRYEQMREVAEDVRESMGGSMEYAASTQTFTATSSAEMLEFAAHLEKLISVEGKVLPTERDGLISLAASLSSQPLELAGGEEKISAIKILTRSLDRRSRLVPLQSAVPNQPPVTKLKNAQELAQKATEYQLAQKAKGIEIDIAQATNYIFTTYGIEE